MQIQGHHSARKTDRINYYNSEDCVCQLFTHALRQEIAENAAAWPDKNALSQDSGSHTEVATCAGFGGVVESRAVSPPLGLPNFLSAAQRRNYFVVGKGIASPTKFTLSLQCKSHETASAGKPRADCYCTWIAHCRRALNHHLVRGKP